MLGWRRAAAWTASARKRARKVGSLVYSLRSTFTATGRPSSVSPPRQTWPMPPDAISSSSAYRPPRACAVGAPPPVHPPSPPRVLGGSQLLYRDWAGLGPPPWVPRRDLPLHLNRRNR